MFTLLTGKSRDALTKKDLRGAIEPHKAARTEGLFTSSMRARCQSSLFSEKALLRMETQLRNTTPIHPIRPAKNMTSRMSLLQSISLNVIDANHQNSQI
jgi:hypothetical protein